MDSKAQPTAHEDVYDAPRKKGGVVGKLYPADANGKGRFKNHCRKFWWCDCLVLIIIVLVVLLPIIFVAIPKKAQGEINKSSLEVTSQEVSNPSPNSIHLKMESLIKSDSSYHPTIDGFPASLTLEGQSKPFLTINIPETKSEAETHVTIDQNVQLSDTNAFSAYTKAVMGSETLRVILDGNTKVHLKGLPSMDVTYHKIVEMKGLNKLSGLNISDVKILSGTNEILSDGSNLVGTVSIPNPSVQTLYLGNVTMNLSVDGKAIGYSLIPNLLLKPGNNSLPMQSRVDQLAVLGLVTAKYKNGVIPLEIVGNSSIANGQHLTYYEDAIKSNTIKLDLNIGPALKGIGINVTSTA